MDGPEVTWKCPGCRHVQTAPWSPPLTCVRCGHVGSGPPNGWTRHPLERCVVCGVGELYRQKDFSVRWGLVVVIGAAVLAYWTWGLSLVVALLLDVWLYRRVPWVVICYYCQAHYRGLPDVKAYAAFDLLKHDIYKTLREQGLPPVVLDMSGSRNGVLSAYSPATGDKSPVRTPNTP